MMEKIDIKVRKNAKGDLIEGDFFVKELSFDECIEMNEKGDKGGDSNNRLIQMCLVNSDGERVFKPQQLKIIPDRLSGVDMMSILIEANGLNDFSKIGEISEKYSKNTQSNQTSE